jgi:hypothetical protein
MSRYGVDSVLHKVMVDDESRAHFRRDPERMLNSGFDLEPDEFRALVERDYGALYRDGAHPFLLVTWAMLVNDGNPITLLTAYCEAVRPFGIVDIST